MKVLQVTAKASSFRRAGRTFGPSATNIPLDDLTKEEAEAIKNEPQLVSAIVDVKEPKAGKDEDGK